MQLREGLRTLKFVKFIRFVMNILNCMSVFPTSVKLRFHTAFLISGSIWGDGHLQLRKLYRRRLINGRERDSVFRFISKPSIPHWANSQELTGRESYTCFSSLWIEAGCGNSFDFVWMNEKKNQKFRKFVIMPRIIRAQNPICPIEQISSSLIGSDLQELHALWRLFNPFVIRTLTDAVIIDEAAYEGALSPSSEPDISPREKSYRSQRMKKQREIEFDQGWVSMRQLG